MKPQPGCDRKISIEQEEYDVLLSELPPSEAEPKPTDDFPELDEKLRKIEFCMLLLIGLVFVVLLLSQWH
jgi:hypothetical protein